ncbi:MAG: hypothetical protein Q7R90_00240 [bacterium]|nr:hypothetical protein [bacterium]
MRKVFVIVGLLYALPLLASAQAGFPDKPLWLSNTRPLAGQEISLSTVLYNGTDTTVGGTLTFYVDDAKLTSQDVSLAAQSSSVVSAKWTAVSGTHSFSAKFATASGATSALQQQTSAIQVTVAEPPPPPPPSALQQNVEQVTAVAGQLASSSAPFVQKVAQAVFTQTEALRNTGIEYLEKKVDPPQASGKAAAGNTTGFVLGTSTKQTAASGSALHTVGQTAAAAGLFILRSFYIFYPILAFIFLFALYWAAKKILRRRRYEP